MFDSEPIVEDEIDIGPGRNIALSWLEVCRRVFEQVLRKLADGLVLWPVRFVTFGAAIVLRQNNVK